MTRLSGKIVIEKGVLVGTSNPSDFNKSDFDFAIRDKGYDVIHEKAYMCPCKSRESSHQKTCQNCGGTGWIFANPTKTKMILTGIMYDRKFEDVGSQDMGMVSVSALNDDKLGFMDKIVILDATSEYTQIVYPVMKDDNSVRFAYTKYDIKSVDFVGLFQGVGLKLKQLHETVDYFIHDNIIELVASYNSLVDPCLTIRYVHNPTYHIVDIPRESMTSTKYTQNQGQTKLIMPINAIAQRAHLIKDVENFDGTRLFDNSWKPTPAEEPELAAFWRQLRYTASIDIYNHLTSTQKTELGAMLP